MGTAAGRDAGEFLRGVLQRKRTARLLLAAAPSQEHTLVELARHTDIDFTRVEMFHMDDYIGLHADAPQGFANWLQAHFIRLLDQDVEFHRIAITDDAAAAATAYEKTMGSAPFDLVLCGFGVTAHLAFNDPPADFNDPRGAKVVTLNEASRRQQVDEGLFPAIGDVPTQAITVTVPRLLNADRIIASVPGREKADAVARVLSHDPTPEIPATALKFHPNAHLYIDSEAAEHV